MNVKTADLCRATNLSPNWTKPRIKFKKNMGVTSPDPNHYQPTRTLRSSDNSNNLSDERSVRVGTVRCTEITLALSVKAFTVSSPSIWNSQSQCRINVDPPWSTPLIRSKIKVTELNAIEWPAWVALWPPSSWLYINIDTELDLLGVSTSANRHVARLQRLGARSKL